jgi:hypothetical protein
MLACGYRMVSHKPPVICTAHTSRRVEAYAQSMYMRAVRVREHPTHLAHTRCDAAAACSSCRFRHRSHDNNICDIIRDVELLAQRRDTVAARSPAFQLSHARCDFNTLRHAVRWRMCMLPPFVTYPRQLKHPCETLKPFPLHDLVLGGYERVQE